MRDLGIFQNKKILSKKDKTIVLHEDNMLVYNSWFLTEYHGVETVIYRGPYNKMPESILPRINQTLTQFRYSLNEIGTPANILITESSQDTY